MLYPIELRVLSVFPGPKTGSGMKPLMPGPGKRFVRLFCERFFQMKKGDCADGLQARGAEFVERVIGGVPGVVFEIDEIDRGDAGDHTQADVIVENGAFVEFKMIPRSERFGTGQDFAHEFLR